MKKNALFFIMVLSIAIMNAQNINDALLYSTDQLSGSARVRAMSGAFGALGGDISSISINPAASAVFLTSEIGGTLGNYSLENENSFFNTPTSDSKDRFDLSQAGVVFVFNNTNPDNSWKKFSIGINYNINNNYNNNNFIAGINPNNGIDKYFLHYAQGEPLENLVTIGNETLTDLYQYLGEYVGSGAQQAFLGYQTYILDPVSEDNTNTAYVSNALYSNGIDQQYFLSTRGANRKFSFNVATQYKDFLYMGLNINSYIIDLKKTTYLSEIGFDADSPIQETGFRNYLEVYGSGISVQLGAIAKVTKSFRVGFTYESPTWYQIDEEERQEAFGISQDENGNLYDADVVRPDVTNVYATYNLRTPGKITGSLAYVFGKLGVLSFDYTRKDYSNSKFSPDDDPSFRRENNNIANLLTVTNSYKLGAEVRVERLSLRGGYRFEQSPYRDGLTVGDLKGYSAGLGYDFGGFQLDLSYDIAEQDSRYQLYAVGLTDKASVTSTYQNIMLGFKFKL